MVSDNLSTGMFITATGTGAGYTTVSVLGSTASGNKLWGIYLQPSYGASVDEGIFEDIVANSNVYSGLEYYSQYGSIGRYYVNGGSFFDNGDSGIFLRGASGSHIGSADINNIVTSGSNWHGILASFTNGASQMSNIKISNIVSINDYGSALVYEARQMRSLSLSKTLRPKVGG